jgi:hypothetical protein
MKTFLILAVFLFVHLHDTLWVADIILYGGMIVKDKWRRWNGNCGIRYFQSGGYERSYILGYNAVSPLKVKVSEERVASIFRVEE